MPADALPQPHAMNRGRVRLERTYRDPLGRTMHGSARIAGATRTAHGPLVVAGVPVTAQIVDGLLAVELPPGTYEVTADLLSADGERAREAETVTLG